jgi:uncharacterized protein (UPF0332 family)
MNADEFLELAGEWCTGTREGEWRSAVSRAYFAVFHIARRLLQRIGFEVAQGDRAHSYLWMRLANAGHPDVIQAGNDLNYLRRIRNWADYDLDRVFPQPLAVAQVQVGDDLAQLLQGLLTTPTVLAQIASVIQVYERDVLKEVTWQP